MTDISDALVNRPARPNNTSPRSSSLAAKLLRVVLGIYLSLAISVTVVQLFLEYENEEKRLAKEIQNAAGTFGPILSQALWNIDDEQIEAALKGILGINRDVMAVKLTAPNEQIIHYFKSQSNSELFTISSNEPTTNNQLFESFHFSFPLVYSSEFTSPQNVGILTLYSNSNVVLKRAAHTFFITIISAIFKTCFLWIIFYVIMQRMIGRPLKQVTLSMAKLNPNTEKESPDSEFSDDLLSRDDELGIMIRTFKEMESALNEKNRTLHAYQTHLEEKVAERTQQLEKASQAKTDFLAAMSHEIRTPMNGVLGMTQLLADTTLNEKQLKYIKVIQNSSESLIDIINGILDHLKIEAGKIELENTPFDLESILDDCTAIFTYKSTESKIKMIPVFKPSCPTWVNGDPTRVRQIITNLLGNAFKFTRAGEIILSAEKIQDHQDGTVIVRLTVKDTGIGIDKEKQSRLFVPFSQADNSTTRRYGGTGLGLSICKQLTDIMNGTIGFESQEGKGSRFWVELPFTIATKAPQEEQDTHLCMDNLKGKKLLVIDDHEAFREITVELARAWGMDTVDLAQAKGAQNLIQTALDENCPVDVAIIDVSLPDTSGIDLSQALFQHFGSHTPKILLVTAYQNLNINIPLSAMGVSSFIEKPISNKELKKALLTALSPTEEMTSLRTLTEHGDDFSQLKVMVAEDNQVNQLVIQGFLNKFKISPTIVENGLLAIEQCQRDNFDLILMDCEMPELDGWEASRQIRALRCKRDNGEPVKIFALSAHAMEQYLEKAKVCGMDGYLYKPVNLKHLVAVLTEIATPAMPQPPTQSK